MSVARAEGAGATGRLERQANERMARGTLEGDEGREPALAAAAAVQAVPGDGDGDARA